MTDLPAYKWTPPSERHKYDRTCDRCGPETAPLPMTSLRSKTVVFKQLGLGGGVIRSRVTEWLCDEHMKSDPDYQRAPRSSSPGARKTIKGGGS